MKVVLIGFMGSGKSTVARLLAAELGYKLIETDDLILKDSGCSSIAGIFERFGEEHFRKMERELAEKLRPEKNAVISPGGGMVANPENRASLKAGGGILIYLKTDFETLQKRIEHDINTGGNTGSMVRPLFSDPEKARQLYDRRLAIYEEAADMQITTDLLPAERVSEKIASELKQRIKDDAH